MKLFGMKNMIRAALCAALCVVLPMAFHAIPNAGSVILPMHIPVLLCGLICGWPWGFLCGLIGPALSSLLTGMPPAAILPAMMVECCTYGLVAGIMIALVKTKHRMANLYISLVTAMIVGRIVAGAAKALIFAVGEFGFAMWATSYFVTGLPGIIIQLALLPLVVVALEKARVITPR
ncbi:MAG: ECF transporter S component [Oscillospiraceae bacterium]|nr:ECF transporter S component [Oscillospiraceae bacterium]